MSNQRKKPNSAVSQKAKDAEAKSAKPTAKSANAAVTKGDKPKPSQAKPTNQTQQQKAPAKNSQNAKSAKANNTAVKDSATTAKPAEKTTAPKNDKPAKIAAQPGPAKAKGGVIAPLALLVALVGTGIGLYNYDQLRKAKATDATAPLLEKIKGLEAQVKTLSSKNNDALTAKLEAVSKNVDTFAAKAQKTNERLSAIEQTQTGLTQTLQGDVKATLDARLQEVNNLLAKIDQIEMTQQGISQSLNQAVSAGEAVTAEGMAKQEVGYLLRMADYKIQSEGDASGAAGLLEIAEKKLLLLNEGQTSAMIDNIRQKYIQLRGVKAVDSNALIGDIKRLSAIVPKLQPKPTKPAEPAKVGEAASDDSLLSKVGNIIASGVKYTPNDPSKIDISAETVLIEKRLMQADLRTAELAIRSQNGVLLAETINAIRGNLSKYFANDDSAKAITSTLNAIEQQKLETVLPDLSGLVKQYEQRQ